MTGDALFAKLQSMTPEQRANDLSVQVGTELYTLLDVVLVEEYHEDFHGVVDDGNPILICNASETMKDFYDNGECPGCCEEIACTATDGDECPNCGHVFWRHPILDDPE